MKGGSQEHISLIAIMFCFKEFADCQEQGSAPEPYAR